jgi:hypothetical protein
MLGGSGCVEGTTLSFHSTSARASAIDEPFESVAELLRVPKTRLVLGKMSTKGNFVAIFGNKGQENCLQETGSELCNTLDQAWGSLEGFRSEQ